VAFTVRLPAEHADPPAQAAQADESTALPTPGTLVCVGLDDTPFCRDMQLALMEHFLHADMGRSLSVGDTLEEQDGFVDLALGRVDPHGVPVSLG